MTKVPASADVIAMRFWMTMLLAHGAVLLNIGYVEEELSTGSSAETSWNDGLPHVVCDRLYTLCLTPISAIDRA